MNQNNSPDGAEARLSRAARRVAQQPTFVAYALEKYRRQETQTEAELMRLLDCFGAAFYQLALCHRPADGAPDFAFRVRRIADSVGAQAGALAQILRQVAHLESLEIASTFQSGAQLMAARENEDDDREPNS